MYFRSSPASASRLHSQGGSAVRIKLGLLGSRVVNAHPEFEDCLAVAQRHAVPVKQVVDTVKALYHQQHKEAPPNA